MHAKKNVGIVGVGLYLPDTVRTNNAWSDETVATWKSRLSLVLPPKQERPVHTTEGVRLSLEAIETLREDPFQGARERRVMSKGETASAMAVKAGMEALKQAAMEPCDIDFLLTHAMLPEYICVNGSSMVHEKLGLRADAPGITVDAVCGSALAQLELAEGLIGIGRAKRVLLTQVANCSPIMPMEHPFSAWSGDAASALVVSEVEDGLGLLATAYRTDGSLHGGFVATIPDKQWYEDGHVTVCNVDKVAAKRMQMECADGAKVVVDEALAKAGIDKREVALFVCHQASAWLPGVCQERCGLSHAKSLNTFSWTGGIHNVNGPAQLALAHKEGVIRKGDVVVVFMTSAGLMFSAAVMRWAF